MNNDFFFLLYLMIQYIWDRSTDTMECDSNNFEIYLFSHHILSTYLYLGGVLYNPLYHMIFLIILVTHWITNNNECVFTVQTNKYCGYPEKKSFKDILSQIGIFKSFTNIHYIIVGCLLLYDIYKIIKK